MLDKSKYFDEVKSYKFIANKSLGQNFLVDSSIAEKIVEKLEVNDSDNVLEIGAGLGSLSYFLAQKSGKKTLIDIDEKMLGFLQEKCARFAGKKAKYFEGRISGIHQNYR